MTFDQCVVWARLRFQEMFFNSISQLLHNFPHDQIDSHGNPFWSGHKRAPSPLVFDMDDASHMDFIVAASNLRAYNYGPSNPASDG